MATREIELRNIIDGIVDDVSLGVHVFDEHREALQDVLGSVDCKNAFAVQDIILACWVLGRAIRDNRPRRGDFEGEQFYKTLHRVLGACDYDKLREKVQINAPAE